MKLTADDYRRMSKGEVALWAVLSGRGGWIREYPFAPPRRWRFDLANPALKLAIEVQGGSAWGRHGQVSSRERDYEKWNTAVCLGWRILQGSTRMAEDGTLLAFLEEVIRDGRSADD